MRRICLATLAFMSLVFPPTVGAAASRADRALEWAMDHSGHREVGTTNCSKWITRWERDMGLDVPPCRPWCGAFVHQALLQAGVKLSARMIDPARTAADARARRRGLRQIPLNSVRRGDILLFAFSRKPGVPSHMALVRGRPSGGRVNTVEGNVGHRSVMTSRLLRIAVMAIRVDGL